MLRIDGYDYAQLPDSHPLKGIVERAIKALKDLHLKAWTITEARRKQSRDAEGNLQHSNGCFINCTQRYQWGGASYRVEYYDTITYDGGKEKLLPISLDFDGMAMELKGLSNEKIFFILCVDPQSQAVEGLLPFQNEFRRPSEYVLLQPEKEARFKMQTEKERIELEQKVYDLENDHDRLLDVCYNFGIATTGKEDWELVSNLAAIILMRNAQGDYNREVISRFRAILTPAAGREEKEVELRALVGRLIETGTVIAHGTSAGAWYLDQEKTQKLCTFQAKGKKEDALLNYFITHRDQIPVFKEKLALLNPV